MDLFGRKERAWKEQMNGLWNDYKNMESGLKSEILLMQKEIKILKEDNKKLKEELEVKDYIGQGIHNILNYNGEPQKAG